MALNKLYCSVVYAPWLTSYPWPLHSKYRSKRVSLEAPGGTCDTEQIKFCSKPKYMKCSTTFCDGLKQLRKDKPPIVGPNPPLVSPAKREPEVGRPSSKAGCRIDYHDSLDVQCTHNSEKSTINIQLNQPLLLIFFYPPVMVVVGVSYLCGQGDLGHNAFAY